MTTTPAAIDCWVFDLDNTLYPPAAGLFTQIDQRMGAYIMQIEGCDAVTARTIQKRYFHDHGTTLSGLMRHHGTDPDHFLDFVHDVDLSVLAPDPALRRAIAATGGHRHIFTNADANYAARVLGALGLADLFDDITDVRATGYIPKPAADAYRTLAERLPGFAPERTLFVDDMSRNLRPAHAIGITTVWLDNGSEAGDRDHHPAHVDHHIDALADWLMGVATGQE